MLSQQNIIYLGIALLIVGIAFFAYQELQKHHAEIERLRMQGNELRLQSQKLEKIIRAYNMSFQNSNEYLNGMGNSDESDTSDTGDYSSYSSEDDLDNRSDNRNYNRNGNRNVSSDESDGVGGDVNIQFAESTISNLIQTHSELAGRTPTRVTVSSNGTTLQFPVLTPMHVNTPYYTRTPAPPIHQNPVSNTISIKLPDVETFDIKSCTNQIEDELENNVERTINCENEIGNSEVGHGIQNDVRNDAENDAENEVENELEQASDVDDENSRLSKIESENEIKKESKEGCPAINKTKGEVCGKPIKMKGLCLRHFRSENKN